MPGISKAKELREQRAQIHSRMKEITEKPLGENGQLSAEQRAEFDKIHAQQETLLADAQRIEAAEDLEKELAESMGTRGRPDNERGDGLTDDTPEPEKVKQAKERRAFDAYLRFGARGIKDPELRGIVESRFMVPGELPAAPKPGEEARAQSVGVDTAGGYLVSETYLEQIVEAQALFGGMRSAGCTTIRTAKGGTINLPTDNDTSNTGALLGENITTSETSVSVSQVRFNDYTYTSNYVLVSRQLMQDSAFDIGAFLQRKFARRLGTITNLHFTTGDGAAKPYGIVTQATQGVAAATGQTASITTDDLVALEHSVDPVYRNGAKWMFRDSTLRILKQLKDGEARPIWLPGIAVRAPDAILGYPFVINTDVAAMSASAKSILFGDFSSYWIRDVLDMTVLRLDERWAEYFQVGFLAFARHDGRLVDAGTRPIKYYQNSAT